MKIKALGHHVIIKVPKPEERTKGGILIPETTRDAERRAAELGEVMDVGQTAWMADGLGGFKWAEVGDKVWFAKYAGKWVQDPDSKEEYLIVADTDVIAKHTGV